MRNQFPSRDQTITAAASSISAPPEIVLIPQLGDVGAPSRVFEVVSMLPLLFVVAVQRGENAAAGLLLLLSIFLH